MSEVKLKNQTLFFLCFVGSNDYFRFSVDLHGYPAYKLDTVPGFVLFPAYKLWNCPCINNYYIDLLLHFQPSTGAVMLHRL